ncbi:MAG: molybdopterin-guanine dinucleotide biosynthesis protein B, partial [Planctomycetales bacterium]|nr:molybdopterin-guanine dinucleotide biosynthesis protein B [Planctomycetales bacterium]
MDGKQVKRLHIIGGKNHGKTTLIVDLVQSMTATGLRVGTIKHTHHHHELDTPGKDSHRHREAGAQLVGICSPAMNAIFCPPTESENTADKYSEFGELFDACDVVLV